LRALEAKREQEQEREEREKERKQIIDRLETSDADAAKVIARSRAQALKRSSARTAAIIQLQSNAKLLRSKAAQSVIPDVPHVPLQDNWYAYEDMFVLKDVYEDPRSQAVRRDTEGIMRAGGYRVEEAWERAIRSAVAGLDVVPLVGVEDEKRTPLDSGDDVLMRPA
jgi:CDK-activating kinase assembly factor MAT1